MTNPNRVNLRFFPANCMLITSRQVFYKLKFILLIHPFGGVTALSRLINARLHGRMTAGGSGMFFHPLQKCVEFLARKFTHQANLYPVAAAEVIAVVA